MCKPARPYGFLSVLCAVGLMGCAAPTNLQTAEANLARQVMAEHCVIGLMQEPSEWWALDTGQMRMGKVSKRVDGLIFRARHHIAYDSIYVYSIKPLADGWVVVDAASEGVRDNLYLNRITGEYACSIDEWRAVHDFPQRLTFETCPYIAPGAEK